MFYSLAWPSEDAKGDSRPTTLRRPSFYSPTNQKKREDLEQRLLSSWPPLFLGFSSSTRFVCWLFIDVSQHSSRCIVERERISTCRISHGINTFDGIRSFQKPNQKQHRQLIISKPGGQRLLWISSCAHRFVCNLS